MLVTTVFGLILAVLDVVALAITGIPCRCCGVLAFLTNHIPNVGFLLGLVPPAVPALLEGGWQHEHGGDEADDGPHQRDHRVCPIVARALGTGVAVVVAGPWQRQFPGNRERPRSRSMVTHTP
ncbi:hypothetical protein [Prauserella flavalba]|uniref:Uncharacterized protein n=1 Tax=Prauserella flavalba TaxID=1477506 RepID=A0A318LJ83_9PSEU|nr:hypothetical protein BA062_26990 [Prauserella flavalba]